MRAIPGSYLSLPILIQFDTGSSGSGFYLKLKNDLYLATAKHVLVGAKNDLHGKLGKLTSYSDDLKDKTPTVLELDFENLKNNNNVKLHSTRDVALVKIGECDPSKEVVNFTLIQGVKLLSKAKTGLVWTTESAILGYDNILVSNDIFIFGYPSSIGMQNSPQFDYNRPLIRKGVVATKYEKADTIILDCPVYYGNSGGPVVQVEEIDNGKKLNVIGVVSQFVPYVEKWINNKNQMTNTTVLNSGYSVAVSIDSVLELIT